VLALSTSEQMMHTFNVLMVKKLLSLKPVVTTRRSYEMIVAVSWIQLTGIPVSWIHETAKIISRTRLVRPWIVMSLQTGANFLGTHSTTSVKVSVIHS
jgi:hypothetical protein